MFKIFFIEIAVTAAEGIPKNIQELIIKNFSGNVASADNFRYTEYFGNEGLELVNSAAAYEKGFTGIKL